MVEFLVYRFLLHTLRRDNAAMHHFLRKYRNDLADAEDNPHVRWAKQVRKALLQGRIQHVLQLQDDACEKWIPGYDTRGAATGFLADLAVQDVRLQFLQGAPVAFQTSFSRGRLSALLGRGKSQLRTDDPLDTLPIEICMQEAEGSVDFKATAQMIAARKFLAQ